MTIVMADECSRGNLLGSVYACCIIPPPPDAPQPPFVPKSWDSKKLSAKKRKILSEYIKTHSVAWAIGTASPREIDTHNILKAYNDGVS